MSAAAAAPAAAAAMTRPPVEDQFLKGIALSVYQNSGDTGSNWTDFIQRKGFLGQKKYAPAFATAADFWNMYETDIKLAASMGATSFRFSFEWARLEPVQSGQGLLPSAIERYEQIIDCIRANGMEPMATLHHFVHPTWFEDLGGFEKEENVHHFVTYSCAMFAHFSSRVRLWSTFNEPTCFAFVGYIAGLWAPGKLLKVNLAGTVLLNLLKAHCAAYRAMKKLPGGPDALIGMVHQHIAFEPRHNLAHVRAMCKWMTFWFGTYTVLHFFTTGEFQWESPFASGGPKTLYTEPGLAAGEKLTDWWGINYYSRPCVHWNFSMGASAANEPVTDTHFRLYPQGLYDSIKDAATALGKTLPIYITEIGLADAKDRYRGAYIKDIYDTVLRAVSDGYNVRGAYWWTLMDNIEWHEGFHIKFGLYQWDPEFAVTYKDTNGRPPGGLKLREGAKALPVIYNTWPDSLTALSAYAQSRHAPATAVLDKPGLPTGVAVAVTSPKGLLAQRAATGKSLAGSHPISVVASSNGAAAGAPEEDGEDEPLGTERVSLVQTTPSHHGAVSPSALAVK